MAFGTITVQTESGDYTEYELTKPTSSIGRQPGNDIVLQTSAVSRYHAQIEVAEGQVFLVDLGTVNGTFVNDHQIEPNSRVSLDDGDVITVGDVQLTFSTPTQRRKMSIREAARLKPSAVPVDNEQLPFRLILDEPGQSISPGARLKLSLIIENLDSVATTYAISVGGLDSNWVKTNWRELEIDPGEQAEVQISIRPPRASDTWPGLYPLTVRVTLKDNPNQYLEAVREIDVVGYRGFAMAVAEGHSPGLYHVAAQNQGNSPLDVQLEGYNRADLLRYKFEPDQIHLDPGETAQVTVTVRPKQSLSTGDSKSVSFAIIARSLDVASYQAPLIAYYSPPSRPSWLPWAIGGGVLAILLAVVLLLLGGSGLLIATGILDPLISAVQPATETPLPTPLPDTPVPATATPDVPPTLTPTSGSITLSDFTGPVEPIIYGTAAQPAEITFAWNIVGVSVPASLTSENNGLKEDLTASQLATGSYTIPIERLIQEVGWRDQVYKLTLSGNDQVHTAVVSIDAMVCNVGEADIYEQTDENSKTVTLPEDMVQVMLLGRSPDALWLHLGNYEHPSMERLEPIGWYLVDDDELDCPDDLVIEQLVVAEPPSEE